MRTAAGSALAIVLAAAAAGAQPADPASRPPGAPRQPYANPSAVIAAELALGRSAREKGQWRAMRDAAAPGAVVFAPRAVGAADWLKRGRPSADLERWAPQAVWMSCDGDYAVSRGQWTRGAGRGEYVVVWRRQEKGDWKWLLREESDDENLGAAPEMIAGQVAECFGLPRRGRRSKDEPPPVQTDGTSVDRSLRWRVEVAADCSRTVAVEIWDGKALAPVFAARRRAPVGGCI